jgi:ribonuclease HI
MPDFTCVSCSKAFSLADDLLAKYPGWTPRYCRACSPKKGKKKAKKRRPAARTVTAEENLTLDEVLAKYTDGPMSGLFTDGGCTPNPGPGGWGVVHVEDGEVVAQEHGHDADTTNNRMELTAIINALELVDDDVEVVLYTDSKLCVDTLESWAAGWEKRGWRRKTGAIKNLELVQRAYALRKARPKVKIEHIRAHSGNRWNEYADSLATAWSRETL